VRTIDIFAGLDNAGLRRQMRKLSTAEKQALTDKMVAEASDDFYTHPIHHLPPATQLKIAIDRDLRRKFEAWLGAADTQQLSAAVLRLEQGDFDFAAIMQDCGPAKGHQ